MEGGPDSVEAGELYTVEQAAKILERTPGRVRQLLRSGDLEGEHEGGDPSKPWRAYAWSVHAYRDAARGGARERREGTATDARGRRGSPETGPDLFGVVQGLQRELGRLEGRLELTAQAESTAREDLERIRAERNAERERAERERERADDLRRELEEERAKASRGFWRRLFGG